MSRAKQTVNPWVCVDSPSISLPSLFPSFLFFKGEIGVGLRSKAFEGGNLAFEFEIEREDGDFNLFNLQIKETEFLRADGKSPIKGQLLTGTSDTGR